jgi:hypothetical protein
MSVFVKQPIALDPFGNTPVCVIANGTLIQFGDGSSTTITVPAAGVSYYVFDITSTTVKNFDIILTTADQLALLARKTDYPNSATASYESVPSTSGQTNNYTFHWQTDVGPTLQRPVIGYWFISVKNYDTVNNGTGLLTTRETDLIASSATRNGIVFIGSLLLLLATI